MIVSANAGMLASRTPDRWGKAHRRHDRPRGKFRKLQTRAQRRAEKAAWRTGE